jgi:hypothetical protein
MYIHVDNRIFEKWPLLGVLLGVSSLVLWIVIYVMVYREYRGYGNSPEIVDLKTIAPPPEDLGKWAQITQPIKINCGLSMQEIKSPPESWLFGRVESTFFIAAVEGSKRNVLIIYEGDISCDGVAKQPFVGVLEELNPRRRSYLTSNGYTLPANTDMQFSLGDGPARTRKLMLIGCFLPLGSIFIIWRFWPRWRAQVQKAERPFSAPTALH